MLTPTRAATVDDLPSWMQLAAEVEPLFGPMPDFEARVRRAIERRTALVIATGNTVAGAALLSRPNQPHHIHWLAVRGSQRRRGVGHALIAAIVDRWPTETIEVVTFTADTAGGAPARRLYESHGFTCVGASDPAPDGSPRDLYILRRDST